MQWWFREKVLALNLQTWFHPSVAIQRSDNVKFDHEDSFTNGYGDQIIQQGDLLHVDFGLTYLRLNTDCQEMAYVRRSDETKIPQYLIPVDSNRMGRPGARIRKSPNSTRSLRCTRKCKWPVI